MDGIPCTIIKECVNLTPSYQVTVCVNCFSRFNIIRTRHPYMKFMAKVNVYTLKFCYYDHPRD